ncbi:peptidyl-tRNA hydrolase, PTH1 family [Thermodesulfovibrio aggregans]|uniref:Peptidyl-tRNA hydrolase n=1 Tax=Thermodesulfovibrio aggregans TaxID=86166 RepID=A0A0U9HYK1_9BACT|nr:aminoacyl-tRNA hydrolase [Thermodesulfovibrio aggregans]GAQ95237.1 peptidyl-tRNA hydrolase, PTH1 family [Thermodesulfovibrio aggregans]
MIIVVGLGNPGKKYANTRHNVGFMIVDEVARKLNVDFKEKEDYFIAEAKINDEDIAIIKPTTYMNLSGRAVKKFINEKILQSLPMSLIVVHDDLDLPLGKIKIKRNGSSGGHRGVQSIIESIGTKDFIRVKLGIGKDPAEEISDYVLSPFKREEKAIIREKLTVAADAIITLITEGLDKAMNIYNRDDL